jgi:hypothetical protein
MGRGRGRGRGKASVTAAPVASATGGSAPVSSCFETFYDGVDDYFNSSEAALKISGQFTFAAEVKFNSLTLFDTIWSCRSANGGFGIYLKNTSTGIQAITTNSGGTNSIPTSADGTITTGVYYKLLMYCDATTAYLYIDDVLAATGASAHTAGIGTITKNPRLGADVDTPSRALNGYVRNITYGSGATSTPTAWVPTDPSSLVGVTEIMYSSEGNGTNRNSISFSTTGAPITAECA